MRNKPGHITKIILINILIYAIVIIAVELLFGSWLKEYSRAGLPIIRSKKIHFDISPLQYGGKDSNTYTRDKYGLRGSFKDPSEIDILTVGGSTVDLRYITDGETWQDVIQDRFHDIGKEVIVANAGIEGASTMAHIKEFDLWFPTIPELKPKYVLFYIGVNDIYLDGERRIENRVSVINNKPEESLKTLIYKNSAVYNLLQSIYEYFHTKKYKLYHHNKLDFSKVKWTTAPLQNSYGTILDENLVGYRKRLNVLADKTKEFGAVPIFVTQPAGFYRIRENVVEGMDLIIQYDDIFINGLDNYYILKKYNEVTMSVCEEQDAICFDFANDIVWVEDDFNDAIHMSGSSMQKIGGYMFDNLRGLYEEQ